jgi:site-specific recombinase XerD
MSPWRHCMIDDIRVRKLREKTQSQLNRTVHDAAIAGEIDRRMSMHPLRHSFATRLLKQKVHNRIEELLQHMKLEAAASSGQVAADVLGAAAKSHRCPSTVRVLKTRAN